MEPVELKAYAKVNLTLEVLGKRDDGYHEIASIVQTIGLYDSITLAVADEMSLECDRPELVSPDNLALKAAALLKQETGCDQGASIRIQKNIPVSAGLGGGSSDAAATLTGLNHQWGLGLATEDLLLLAARLGSDVPYFLHGGTAMISGRGELVRPLPPADLEWIILLNPAIDLPDKTASVYAGISPYHYTGGLLTRKLEARIRGGGDVPPQFLFNTFDSVAPEAFPGLDGYWQAFYSLGAREIHVAGSGPSLFAPVSRREQGTAVALMLRHKYGWDARLVPTWRPEGDGRE
jgi:4-diphosphocytidyl-2-C-methyl-D-erythritol kinase